MSVKMFVCIILLGISLCFTTVSAEPLPKKINQSTYGNQAPSIIALPGSDVHLDYQTTDEQIRKVVRDANTQILNEFSNCLKLTAKFQESTLEALGSELSEILIKNNKIPTEESGQFVNSIINNSKAIKDAQEQIEEALKKYNEELAKKLTTNVYSYVAYILSYIDNSMMSLKKVDKKIKYKKDNKFVLFSNHNKHEQPYLMRRIVFPASNSIQVICIPGDINNGLISNLPSLLFREMSQGKVLQQFKFVAKPRGGSFINVMPLPYKTEKKPLIDIEYPISGGSDLDQKTKNQFSETFTRFFQLAYATQ